MIYNMLVDGLDEDGRLTVDATLGDQTASAEIERRRMVAAQSAGFEVG